MSTMDDLAAALRELVEEYPSDRDTTAGAVVVGSEAVVLHPAHVGWLVRMIKAEMVTFAEAHPGHTGRCGHCGHVPAGADDVDERERQDAEEAGPSSRPGDMVQDDDGALYVHCADGLMRLADADEEPYTLDELDAECGPLMPIEVRATAARQEQA